MALDVLGININGISDACCCCTCYFDVSIILPKFYVNSKSVLGVDV